MNIIELNNEKDLLKRLKKCDFNEKKPRISPTEARVGLSSL